MTDELQDYYIYAERRVGSDYYWAEFHAGLTEDDAQRLQADLSHFYGHDNISVSLAEPEWRTIGYEETAAEVHDRLSWSGI